MAEICILTPDPVDDYYGSRSSGVLDRLAEALAGVAEVRFEPWTNYVEDAQWLARYDLVMPLVAWGYHRQAERWRRATETWQAAGTRMANPASVLGWNGDKTYLRRLADRGVAIPRTLWADDGASIDLPAAFAALGDRPIIVKPTVSGGAWRTVRLEPGQALGEPHPGAVMVQPYLSSIETEGETSLLFFGGRFSHAVNKRPVDGDFRVQVQFGGLYRAVEPDAQAMALAERVLAAIDEPLLYARIDMAHDADGRWVLMEAELIEPDFYLSCDPAKGASFAPAVRERLAGA